MADTEWEWSFLFSWHFATRPVTTPEFQLSSYNYELRPGSSRICWISYHLEMLKMLINVSMWWWCPVQMSEAGCRTWRSTSYSLFGVTMAKTTDWSRPQMQLYDWSRSQAGWVSASARSLLSEILPAPTPSHEPSFLDFSPETDAVQEYMSTTTSMNGCRRLECYCCCTNRDKMGDL